MKKLLITIVLLISPQLVVAEPPKINVAKDGTTVIVAGPNTVTILPDGSLKVQSPILNLTIGGDNPSPVVPPTPPAPAVSDFQKVYDQDPSEPAVKKATLALFVKIWSDAIEKVNDFSNSSEVNDLVSPQLKLLGKPLSALRSAVAAEMQKSFPEPVELTPEKKRSLTEKLSEIVTKLQGVK